MQRRPWKKWDRTLSRLADETWFWVYEYDQALNNAMTVEEHAKYEELGWGMVHLHYEVLQLRQTFAQMPRR